MSKKLGFFLLVAAIAFAMSTMVASAAGVKTNSNETGEGVLSKAVNGHTVHGNYKNNTNSCASCHQTHTASSTVNLLFKSSVDEACEACHDASLGIYNVEDHVSQGSGTFDLTDGYNGSMHNVDGTKTLAAAPGARTEQGGDEWSASFGCESCHNPHGSYSDRLLNVSPLATVIPDRSAPANTIPGVPRVYKRANDSTLVKGTVSDDIYTAFGNQWNNITIIGTYAAPKTTANVIAALPAGALHKEGAEVAAAYVQVDGTDVSTGAYKGSGLTAGDVIVQLYRYSYGNDALDNPTWKVTPVLTTSSKKLSLLIGASQALTSTPTKGTDTALQVNPILGYYKPTAIAQGAATLNKVTLPLIVDMQLKTLAGAPSVNGVTEKVTDEAATYGGANKNAPIGYSEWCGTCHTDYFAYTKTGTGWDSDMYHHNVASSSNGRNCGYCHFAHGTDVTIMKDALGRTYDQIATADFGGNQTSAKDWLKDVNKSSALKRFTNMTVCYGCHASSHYGAMGNNGSTGVGSPAGLGNGIKTSGTW